MTNNITVAGATRTGRVHCSNHRPNQDARYHLRRPDSDTIVAAVSDGAGSASRAQIASYIATRFAVRETANSLSRGLAPEGALRQGLAAACAPVWSTAGIDPNHGIDAYHCTLIIAVASPENIAAIQVGDGACIVATDHGLKMLTIPQQGEYANETYFITSPHAEQFAFFRQTDAASALTMFTDGLQKQAIDFQRRRPSEPFVNAAFATAQGGDQSLQLWLDTSPLTERSDDDGTIIVIRREMRQTVATLEHRDVVVIQSS